MVVGAFYTAISAKYQAATFFTMSSPVIYTLKICIVERIDLYIINTVVKRAVRVKN